MEKRIGTYGKTYEDRQLANSVRKLTLKQMEQILNGKDEEYKRALVLRLATTILPRINELQGTDGEPMEIIIKLRDAKDRGVPPTTV